MPSLRPYQQDCLTRSQIAYERGCNRQLAVLATGLGKTAIASSLRTHHGFTKKVLFLVHLDQLAQQAAKAMHLWNPGAWVGIEMAGQFAGPMDQYVVASVPTLGRKGSDRIKRLRPDEFSAIIQDECFPAGTMVSGIPIEHILPGMSVLSFDEVRGYAIMKRVLRVSKRIAPSSMVLVKVGDTTLTCTPNHPVFTGEGWRNASNLRPGDSVLLELQRATGCSNRITEGATQVQDDRESPLLGGLHTENSLPRAGGSHDGLEPDAQRQISEQDEKDFGEDGASASAGRERSRNDTAAGDTRIGVRGGVHAGICDLHQFGVSTQLQGGHRTPADEVGDRGGRSEPSDARAAGARSEERGDLGWSRVDSVEIQERGSDGRPDRLCGDGYVYNLEIEDTPTYFANGVLVHNCHIGMADSFKRVYDHFGLLHPNPEGPLFLGITATPNRNDGQGLKALFDEIVFDMGIRKGIESGFLCDIRAMRVSGHGDLSDVGTRGGEFIEKELATAVNTPERNAIVVKEWAKHAWERRTICFTANVQHALDLAATFEAHSINAKAVWGEDPERQSKIDAHKSGRYGVICCAQLLGIGYDDPFVSCIVLAAPRKSFVRYAQEVGRGTRIAEGKEDLLVLDVCDSASKHDLCTVSSLLGLPKDLDLKGEKFSKAREQLERVAAEFPTANIQDLKNLDELKTLAENIQLFKVSYPPEVSRLTELAWQKQGDTYVIPVGRERITISADLLGEWWVRGKMNGNEISIPAQNLAGAFNAADRSILDGGGAKSLLARDSRWRQDGPSEKQVALCRKIGLAIPNGATRGMVSAAMDAYFSARRA